MEDGPIHGGWPTADANPFLDLARPEAVLMLAQRCDKIPIEVHPDLDAPEAHVKLITASEASAPRRHRSKILGTSKVPAKESLAPKVPPPPPSKDTPSTLGTKTNPIPGCAPSGTNLFSLQFTYSVCRCIHHRMAFVKAPAIQSNHR
jgi:hypothetical protein